MRKNGMGSHESARMGKDEWLTPPELIRSLGEFDLDPCSPINRPWPTAKNHYTVEDDGLTKAWGRARVFMNPPYGAECAAWLRKLKEHGNGIALIFARTETQMFFESVWNGADALLFVQGRLTFYHVSGIKATMNAGAHSVLVAYGSQNATALQNSGIKGKFVTL